MAAQLLAHPVSAHGAAPARTPWQARSARLVAALARLLHAQVIQTHASWVLLTQQHAYKIKKPLRTAFLDYTSKESRRRCCEEELRVNQRLAASHYIDVVAIGGTPDSPILGGGHGAVLDYAVRMKRFDEDALFASRLDAGLVSAADVDALAACLAAFHAKAAPAPANSPWGTPATRQELAFTVADAAVEALPGPEARELRWWFTEHALRLEPFWQRRREQGFVRECHGDLHLDNIISLVDGPTAFDAIEFDPRLRWIDVMDDIASTVMDFHAHGQPAMGMQFLNAWLDRTGDHHALEALPFAAAHRALARALVHTMPGARQSAVSRRYMRCAQGWTQARPLKLTITHGLPGTGKSHLARSLAAQDSAILVHAEVERERERVPGVAACAGRDGAHAAAGQDESTQARTYERLFACAAASLRAGFPVILDGRFLRRVDRERAQALASAHGASFCIAACEAPDDLIRARLHDRFAQAPDAPVPLEQARARLEPLSPLELPRVMRPARLPDMAA